MAEYERAFDANATTPAEAELKRARADLMHDLRAFITKNEWTQVQAARELGVTQPRISDLMRGKMSKFSIDALISMAATAGLHFRYQVLESA